MKWLKDGGGVVLDVFVVLVGGVFVDELYLRVALFYWRMLFLWLDGSLLCD